MKEWSLIKLFEEEKKDKEKIAFQDTDPRKPFPNDVISKIEKEITKKAKDLDKNWKNALELVNSVFEDNSIEIPKAFMNDRWSQYVNLISHAVKELQDARGDHDDWKIIPR